MPKDKDTKRREAQERMFKSYLGTELQSFIRSLPGGSQWVGRGEGDTAITEAIREGNRLMLGLCKCGFELSQITVSRPAWELTNQHVYDKGGLALVTYLLFEGPFEDFVDYFNGRRLLAGIVTPLEVGDTRNGILSRKNVFKSLGIGAVPTYPGLGLWEQVRNTLSKRL